MHGPHIPQSRIRPKSTWPFSSLNDGMHCFEVFSLLLLPIARTVTADSSDDILLPPTTTAPFLPAWQQPNEYVAMGAPNCEKESSTSLDDLGRDCQRPLPLYRRQSNNECPTSYSNCYGQGAPSLCCQPSAVCSADMAGHVACCPVGAACTGTIVPANTATQTSTSTYGGYSSTTVTSNGLSSYSTASTSSPAVTTSGGFIITASDASLTIPNVSIVSFQTTIKISLT